MIRRFSWVCLAIGVCLALVGARPDDPPSKVEAKPAEVVNPSPEQLARITQTAKRIVPSVFTVGRPGGGGASAFLISRKHRLLATAAHVPDFFRSDEGPMLAISDGTATEYRVDRVFYHPGTLRVLDIGLSARSDDPDDGKVDHVHGPDVAVLRLAEGGPDLPDELPLATPEEMRVLDGTVAGLLGYPSDLAGGWPSTRLPAWAKLACGTLQTSVLEEPSGLTFLRQQRFWVATNLEGGSSGGPAFLGNSHVIGIISAGSRNRDQTWATLCIRVDALLELLQHHRLAGLEPVLSAIGPRADWGNDPRLGPLREAVRKIGDANERRRAGRYQSAGRLCNEVLETFPDYAYAVLERSWVYSDYCDAEWDRLTSEERARFARWASDDSSRCLQAVTDHALPHLVDAQNNIHLGRIQSDPHQFEEVVSSMDRIINNWPRDLFDAAFAHHLRARARRHLGFAEEAEKDLAEAIRLGPEEPRWLLDRAKFYEERGNADLASKDRRKAEEVRRSNPLTSPLPNGGRSPFDLSPVD